MIICRSCGSDNTSDARFCAKCGKPMVHVRRRKGPLATGGVLSVVATIIVVLFLAVPRAPRRTVITDPHLRDSIVGLLRSRTEEFIAAGSAREAERELNLISPRIQYHSYFGDRNMTLDKIRNQQIDYNSRWLSRRIDLSGAIQVLPRDESTAVADYSFSYSYLDTLRREHSGAAHDWLTWQRDPDQVWRVVNADEDVHRIRTGK